MWLQNVLLFVVLDWVMKREFPQSICWVLIAFNDDILVFTYYEFVLVKGNYTLIVT